MLGGSCQRERSVANVAPTPGWWMLEGSCQRERSVANVAPTPGWWMLGGSDQRERHIANLILLPLQGGGCWGQRSERKTYS